MTPLRLFILAILFYIGWLLLKGVGKSSSLKDGSKKEKNIGSNNQVEDVLVEDPVCHILIPKKQAIRFRHKGETFYFCSDTCCDKFSNDQGGNT